MLSLALWALMAAPESARSEPMPTDIAVGTKAATRLLSYESNRARLRLREYVPEGQTLRITSEEVRTLSGQAGSEMTVLCGTTQAREQGKVTLGKFYYVIDVVPVGNLLSDYERGTWSNAVASADDPEHTKLCRGRTAGLDDVDMLISDTLTSTGSTFRPFVNDNDAMSRDWLVGAWVTTSACATTLDHEFSADGSYRGYNSAGRWSLVEGEVSLSITEETDDEEKLKNYNPPKSHKLSISRSGIDKMRQQAQSGDVFELIRC